MTTAIRKPTNQQIGAAGELAAAEFLRSGGYVILARNWRCQGGELDIVARHNRTVVFCEVKTRRTSQFGPPIEAVNPSKARRLRWLALQWLAHAGLGHVPVRFDVVSVLPQANGSAQINHVTGAF